MFRIKRLVLPVLAGLAIFQACNSDKVGEEQTTESGLKYTYFAKGEEQQSDSGTVMILEMVAMTANDSVFFDSRAQSMPFPMSVNDTTVQGMLGEGFRMLKKGDSVEFIIPATDFFTKTNRMPVPADIDSSSNLIFRVGVQDLVTEDEIREMQMAEIKKQQEQALVEQEAQLGKDVQTIDEFLKANNVEAEKTESGLYVDIIEPGNGPEIDAGDEVSVHYRGKLLDGTQFDASFDRGEPISLKVGEGRVIRGWDEGLQLLREGSKATFYIPSSLGYGARGAGPVIKPNSILVFDIEVVDVKE